MFARTVGTMPLRQPDLPPRQPVTDRPKPRTAHRLTVVGGLLVLLLGVLAPATLARSAAARHSVCKSSSHHARHSSSGSRCSKRRGTAGHEVKPGSTRKTAAHGRNGAGRSSARVPARCEDGTLPVREASGAFACGDESEPSCADGSEPTVATGSASLSCDGAAAGPSPRSGGSGGDPECSGEAVCVGTETACEAGAGTPGCAVEAVS